jgi:hypothetical protein
MYNLITLTRQLIGLFDAVAVPCNIGVANRVRSLSDNDASSNMFWTQYIRINVHELLHFATNFGSHLVPKHH